jgi:hypothetical protein
MAGFTGFPVDLLNSPSVRTLRAYSYTVEEVKEPIRSKLRGQASPPHYLDPTAVPSPQGALICSDSSMNDLANLTRAFLISRMVRPNM